MAFLTLAVLACAAAEPSLFDPKALGSQLRGLDGFGASDPSSSESHGRENRWLKDISTSTKNYFKKVLAPLQTPIVQEFQVLTILEEYVNYTMDKIENATGSAVIWNRTSRLLTEQLDEVDEDMVNRPAAGRALYGRRRSGNQDLPPRARYVNKILIYLNKEMDLLWNYNTIIDRKRWGIGNTITSSPYGPHGEHPERWRANGSFPVPVAPNNTILLQQPETKIKLRVKADERKFDNKYALQLQADYYSLVDNINDASQKISDLRDRLWKMNDFADQFIALPSGVWNKIDAQV